MAPETIFGIFFIILGGVITILEIHTLTIYLISVALASFAAAITSFIGLDLTYSLSVFAIILLISLPLTHHLRKYLKNKHSDIISNDDVGNTVNVSSLIKKGGNVTLKVNYRGTTWDGILDKKSSTDIQKEDILEITQRIGNILVLKTRK